MSRNNSNNSKKLKLNNYSDFLNNEDDIDIDALDECFERATQTLNAEKEKLGETSFLQTYNAFPQPQFTSTQINRSITSVNVEENLAQKIKDFEKKYAEKVGEVSILRSNLEQMKATHTNQSIKDIEEWKEKYNSVQNRYEEVKTKLEFKNFENGNLKQKLRHLQINSILKPTTAESSHTTNSYNISNNNISINHSGFYPLKNVDFSSVFQLPNETHYELRRNDAELELMNKLKTLKTIFVDQKELNVDIIYSEINFFIKCTEEEIDSELAIMPMTKIICVVLQFMKELVNYFEIMEENMQPSQIHEIDIVHYQQEQNIHHINNVYFMGDSYVKQKELQCSKIITFLAKLLPLNNYLNKFIFKSQTLLIEKEKCDVFKYLPIIEQKENCNFLEMLLRIVAMIGKLRKTLICTTLLKSIVQFLTKAYESEHVLNSINILNEITFEILYCRPDIDVVAQIILLMTAACQHNTFQEILFRNCANRKCSYFTRETCPFYMFNALVKKMLFKLEDDSLFFSCSNNFVSFIYNIFKTNALLFSKTDERSKCILDLYRVYILVISKSLNRFIVSDSREAKYRVFFKKNLQLLSLWKFNYRELVQQSYQFKGLINRLKIMADQLEFSEFELAELEHLVPEVTQLQKTIDYSECLEMFY